jgi:peroxiredoxin
LTTSSLADELESCTKRCMAMRAPLAQRLSSFADDVRRLAPDFANVVDRMVERLAAAGAGESAPAVGERMPDFVLPDDQGRLVSLEEILQQGKAAIAFHRGHWCPYCRINAFALARIEPEVAAAGGRMVVITPELQKFNRKLKQEAGGSFHILSDLDCGYALELNLAIKINDEKRQAMTSSGWDIAPFQDNNNWILPIPATFVVNPNGIIAARYVDPDYRLRMDIDELLTALRS